MLRYLEFYRLNPDDTRIGGDRTTLNPPSLPIDQIIVQAKSMMLNLTFSWGKANLCLIKTQDGSIVREVVADA